MAVSRRAIGSRIAIVFGMATPPTPRLSRAFFARSAEVVARELLGCTMVRILPTGERLAGRIVETEAYVGVRDQACHTFNGRRTPRNEPMWGPAGFSYIYFTYGMHHCCNIVCGKPGEPIAVLLRALEPVDGLEAMAKLRGTPPRMKDGSAHRALCSGPAKLCQAFSLTRAENLTDMMTSTELWVEGRPRGQKFPSPGLRVRRGVRIGIDSAGVWATKLLRWGLLGSPQLSVAIDAPSMRS
jgi:DNA-3-methyladenine glycosylase